MEQTEAKKARFGAGRKALLAGVAVVVLAAAGMTGYKITLQRAIAAQLKKQGGSAGSVTADLFFGVHLRDLTLPQKDGSSLRVAAMDGRPQFLFLPGMFHASGVEATIDQFKITVPEVSINHASFDRKTLTDVFGDNELSLAERVGRFSARRVAAPEVDVTQTVGGGEQTAIYKDVSLDDVVNGHVGRYSLSGATFGVTVDKPGADGVATPEKADGTIGAVEGKDLDGVFLARLYTEAAGPDDKEPQPVYGPFSVKDVAVKGKEGSFSYGEVRSDGFTMRLAAAPLPELLKKIAAVSDPDALPAAERNQFFLDLLSLFDMIGKGDMELRDMKMKGADAATGEGALDRVAVSFGDQKLDVSIKGFSFAEGKDHMKFAEASWTGFSWAPTAAALKKLAALSDEEAETFPYTTLLPEFGAARVSGLDADLPAEEGAGEGAATDPSERIKLTVKSYELKLGKPYNGIPTDIRIAYDDVAVNLPEKIDDPFYGQLRKMGYDKLVLSSNLESSWDEPSQKLFVKDFSVRAENMGSLSLSGEVGGFSKAFFSGDKVLTQVALLGLKAREVKLKVEEKGLIARTMKLYADENGMSVDDARQALSIGLTAGLQGLAPDQPQLQQAVAAFSAFLAKPNVFELTVKAKSDKGVGALEIAAASQDPTVLLDKVDIDAKAE